jgi:hypothetical protein
MKIDTRCPNDETLMDFLEHRLAGKAREQVIRHLAGCANCRELAAVCAGLPTGELDADVLALPRGLTQRAIRAVSGSGHQPWPDRLIQGMAKGAAVLERIAWRPVADAVAVRGEADIHNPEVIHREKQFGELRVAIDFEKSCADLTLIRVCGLSIPQGAALMRVALISREREVASAALGHAPVLFEEIPMGVYALMFLQQNKVLGEFAFEMTGEV